MILIRWMNFKYRFEESNGQLPCLNLTKWIYRKVSFEGKNVVACVRESYLLKKITTAHLIYQLYPFTFTNKVMYSVKKKNIGDLEDSLEFKTELKQVCLE